MAEFAELCIRFTGKSKLEKSCDGILKKFFLYFFRQDDVKYGDLVGEDKYGNKYFQNNSYFYGKITLKKSSWNHNRHRLRSLWPSQFHEFFLIF